MFLCVSACFFVLLCEAVCRCVLQCVFVYMRAYVCFCVFVCVFVCLRVLANVCVCFCARLSKITVKVKKCNSLYAGGY